jgi:hypothetical protein
MAAEQAHDALDASDRVTCVLASAAVACGHDVGVAAHTALRYRRGRPVEHPGDEGEAVVDGQHHRKIDVV